MIVVADSSPLIVLVKIGMIDVLPTLFGQIVIPGAVAHEIQNPRRPQGVREYFATMPAWLEVRRPSTIVSFEKLDPGETEAINLAMELHADLLLVDERRAYQTAVGLRINAIGTVRVLERAAEAGFVELAEAFDRVKRTDFWISHDLLDERLRLFRGREQH